MADKQPSFASEPGAVNDNEIERGPSEIASKWLAVLDNRAIEDARWKIKFERALQTLEAESPKNEQGILRVKELLAIASANFAESASELSRVRRHLEKNMPKAA